MSQIPKCVLLFSGKRKSGKDYITDLLSLRIGSAQSVIIKLSGPIKTHWAKTLSLDYNKLIEDGQYKEQYRAEMNRWGEEIRDRDYGYFCRAAIDMYDAKSKPIWIVSDIRRKTDVKWFIENFGSRCKTIRIYCSDKIRQHRGWIFTPGIDDAKTECDLDDVDDWNLTIINEGQESQHIVQHILQLIK